MKTLLLSLAIVLTFVFPLGAAQNPSTHSPQNKDLKHSKILKVAFGYEKPPFIFGFTGSKGIEPDLFRAIMEPYGYQIDAVQMSKYYLEHILESSNDFNASVSISRQSDRKGLYYSDDFIFYDNVVITPKAKHLKIRDLEDLSRINFVTWNGAWHDLGPKFWRYFNPESGLYKDRYHDNPSQKEDVRKFFAGQYDALVIDKNIFQWYKTYFDNHETYDYHPIFSKEKGYSAAFRSGKLRDIFNRGLRRIRKNGTYDRIIRYNHTHNFYPLIQYVNLVADLSAPYLYTLQKEKLKKILHPFLLDRNILSIEIIDNRLNRHFLRMAKRFPRQPTGTIEAKIVYHQDGKSLSLGTVRIIYKQDFDFSRQSPIPNPSYFNTLPTEELNRVRTLYERYGLNKVKHVLLTPEERAYLQKKGTIRIHNERNWAPYNFNENGHPKGFVIDYMNLLAQKLGIKLQYVSGYTWDEFLQLAREKRIDVIANIVDTPARRKYLNFTSPYDISHKAIFANKPGFKHISDLEGKTVAVPKGFFIESYLQTHYPKIHLRSYDNVLQCITAVLNHQADAMIESYGVVKYLMNHYNLILPYMTLSNDPELQTELSLGIRKDEPMLKKIFQKAIDAVTPQEKRRLKAKWFDIQKRELSPFSLAQEEYIRHLHTLRFCANPNWKPIEFVENGKAEGISIDVLHLIAERLGAHLEYVPTKSWSEAQEFLRMGRCDILPAATRTPEREHYAYFTQPYLHYPIAIITRVERPMVTTLDTLSDKSMARKRGSGLIQLLKRRYPDLKIVKTDSYDEAFEKVRKGQAYFTLATLPILAYYQNLHSLKGLKIAGYLSHKMELSVAISKRNNMLYGIVDKVLSQLPPETLQIINDKWTTAPKVLKTVDYSLLFKVIAIFLLLFLIGVLAYLKLHRLNRQIDTLNRTLEQRVREEVARSREKDRMVFHQNRLAQMGEMISMIAHQWRQPLNNLSILNQSLQHHHRQGRLTAERLQTFEKSSTALIRQMSKTIDDFRNFFRPDKKAVTFTLDQVVEQVREIVAPVLEKEAIRLNIDVPSQSLQLTGYPNELGQVLLNLVNNAKDAFESNNKIKEKWIRLTIEDGKDSVRLIVEDNAGGIPAEYIDKIFDPYFSTKNAKNGTGLGLYISRQIVEEHMKGKLWAVNTEVGARFEMIFPKETEQQI
ncbi:transporter substrate-binding domain-containing protein [Nitratifractor sp.]